MILRLPIPCAAGGVQVTKMEGERNVLKCGVMLR